MQDILEELKTMRQLYADVAPADQKVVERYAWVICKSLQKYSEQFGGLLCRQLLSDALKLPIQRPSLLYSSLLRAAIKVYENYYEFHFVPFLNYWNIQNLRQDDYERYVANDGKTYSSLAEKMAKHYSLAILRRPEEKLTHSEDSMTTIAASYGYQETLPMVVTKISQADVSGRKIRFASLVAADGTEASCEIHILHPSISSTQESDKRHYVNVGQLYRVCLRKKKEKQEFAVVEGILTDASLETVFPTCIGYVESIDAIHSHIHVYDGMSRHFVSSGQRLNVRVGQYVRFVPVIPSESKFKTAIISFILNDIEGPDAFGLRTLRVTYVNDEKKYVSWELADSLGAIVEKGTSAPSYTTGFIGFSFFEEKSMTIPSKGDILSAIVFLKRGLDGVKRPRVYFLKK